MCPESAVTMVRKTQNISPLDMIRNGRSEKLRRFVTSALEENAASEGIAGRWPTRGAAEASR